ncbi:50S ribosomal protein L22 [Candidatus Woesearchaeota archaeon]|nr:50S ribosomal protein L22 [Candidatus Woesearchaeota archaeon]
MAKYNYSCKIEENMACAVGRDLPISTKHAIEICSKIRGKSVEKILTYLNNVIILKEAVPFRRFNDNVGHKKKIGPGRYPIKAAKAILGIVENAQANAQSKGLATGRLEICHTCAHKASAPMRRGRQGNRSMKRTHVEIVLRESVKKEREKKKKAPVAKNVQKVEEKPKAAEKPAPKPEVKQEEKISQ